MSTSTDGLIITETAAKNLKSALESYNVPDHGIRLRAINQGCSNPKCTLDPEESPATDDIVLDFTEIGLKVFIDPSSHILLKNVTLDYKVMGDYSGFVFMNRSMSSPCQGCSKKCSG